MRAQAAFTRITRPLREKRMPTWACSRMSRCSSSTAVMRCSIAAIAVTSVTVLTAPAKAAAGDTINVTETTADVGAGDAPDSVTRFFLSVNASLDATDTPIGSRLVPALNAGGSSAVVTQVTIPASMPTGAYYLFANADDDRAITETVETNNSKYVTIKIGPDLTSADRRNTESLLINIVNPSAYIRPEYVNYEVQTKDDQLISGLLVESSPTAATILDRNNQRTTVAREQVKSMTESSVSLMPDGLLEALTPEQIMDLFTYLQGDGPLTSDSAN